MSSNPENDVDLPEDDQIEEDFAAPKGGMSPGKKLLIGGSVAVAIMGSLMFVVTPDDPAAQSSMRRPPRMDTTPGGENTQSNQLYRESNAERNQQLADHARESGGSFIATPEGVLEPLSRLDRIDAISIEPEAAPVVAEPAPLPQRERRILPRPAPAPAQAAAPEPAPQAEAPAPTRNPDEPNPYTSMVSNMMQSTQPGFRPRPMGIITISSSDERSPAAGYPQSSEGVVTTEPCENCASPAGSAAVGQDLDMPLLRPGDILYAETLNSVNSDIPSAIIAEIVAGPYKGSRVVGGFQADAASGGMVVQFSAMTLRDGTTISIAGLAVDGRTAEDTVRSDIERRYVKRYGPALAASFISTYASAISRPEERVVDMGDGTQIVTEAPTERQAIAAGVSTGLDMIARDVASYAPKGPKITLRDGWPLAVMITSPMQEAVPAQPGAPAREADYRTMPIDDLDVPVDAATMERVAPMMAQ